MKNLKKLISFAVIFVGITTAAFAQVTATANASATIVGPIGISRTLHMNFGNVAVSTSPGTIVMTPASVRTTTGGCTLPAVTGTVTAATFTVSGADGYTYSITLPSTDVTITDGTNNMIVNTFTSNPSGTGTLTGGSEVLTVGATLNVSGSQVAGTYTSSTPFDVTVNYN